MAHWPDWLDELLDIALSGHAERRDYLQIWAKTLVAVVVVAALGFLFLKILRQVRVTDSNPFAAHAGKREG